MKYVKNLFRRFDPRLARELKTQRKPILTGLFCVIVTSLLTAATIPIIQYSVAAISDAGRISSQRVLNDSEVSDIAKAIDKTPVEVKRALKDIEAERSRGEGVLSSAEQRQLAVELNVEPAKVFNAVGLIKTKPIQSPEDALKVLGLMSVLIVVVYSAKYWFTRGQIYYLSYASAKLANDLRIRMFRKLQRLPIKYFNESRVGAIQSVLTNDVTVYQNAVGVIRDSIDGPIKAISAFAYIIKMQWQLAAVAVLFFPIMAFFIQRNSKQMKVSQAKVQDDLSDLSAMTQEALQGTRIVKAFSAEDRVLESYTGHVDTTFKSAMKAVHRFASLRPSIELIGAIALASVFFICGRLAYAGWLQVADIAALIYAMDVINQGVRAMGYVNNTYAQVQAASDRIYSQILDIEEDHAENEGSQTIDNPIGKIVFEHVSFSYPDGTEALRNVSFEIEPGQSLALVGPSGAGKSTIADLLLRFYDPTAGRITFDNIDYRELKVSWLRSQIGVVPQHTFLFAGTIAENIRMGSPDATDQEVTEAARAAHADGFIGEMSDGFQTELGERGLRLSGGQMQRVAIARAFIRKPTLLLLDEATSALDAVSEKAVQEALDEIMKERTTLFIAHRLTTAARADRILMLRRGEVMEIGSHSELLEANGPYAGMYRAFSSGLLEDQGL